MHPSVHAATRPDHPAIIMAGSGETLTYAELDARSNQYAQLFRKVGIKPQDHIAIFLENCVDFMPLIWAAQRTGLVYTPISTHLLDEEVAYILENSGARLLITSDYLKTVATEVRRTASSLEFAFMLRGVAPGFKSLEAATADLPTTPVDDEEGGTQMLYSSGTTGLPKGVLVARPPGSPITEHSKVALALVSNFGIGPESVYLSPAPLYHAAPLAFNTISMALGGTSVIMERFDPVKALEAIERYCVTHSQWVPIMFVRMLKLPEADRTRFDLSTQQIAIHAAAPCPVEVKRDMIEWWGPRLFEYYASTEGAGFTAIDSVNWLSHPGSVGQPVGCSVRILDDSGYEIPNGEVGGVYFSANDQPFHYHKEPEKTADSFTRDGWATVGDVGYVDDDGFLYLTDRKHYMIITGGVNVYPQEIENALITHAEVADAAVFGLPDPEFGERVHAVVQPAPGVVGDSALADRLTTYLRAKMSHIKIPRSIDFDDALPRHDNGKLYKRRLLERYQQAGQ
ncbi:MAG: acyl-CoA synthetase [Pseudomonadota bacterium]